MASRGVYFLIFISAIILLSNSVQCDHDEEDLLLQSINDYRVSLNLTGLVKNKNAECLADEVAEQFQNQPCTNSTGANTVPGTEPQFSNYPTLLAKCHLNVSNTRDGIVLPACVPNLESSLVVSNFTRSQYSDYLNDTKFTGVGIGHEDNWIVVVLTTNTAEGSFVPSQDTVETDDDHDDRKDLDDHDDRNDHDDHDDRNDHDDHDDHKDHDDHDIDDDDILLSGINAHRNTSGVAALVKSKRAECFADEFADRFQDQPCTNTTGSITEPGAIPSVLSYPQILFKCNLNVSEGIILPVCALNFSSNIVLASLKSSRHASVLDDPKFTGIGIGSEDDWEVIVLTTGGVGADDVIPGNTVNSPNPFNKANAVDGINSISKASFVTKTSLIHHFMLLLIAFFLL